MNALDIKEKKDVIYKSCFDIIGPIMIGPSSSHTAGALAMGLVANKLFKGLPKRVVVKYYESFAETHKGHGTDFAIIAGVLGFEADDIRVPNAIKMAESKGINIVFLKESGNSPVGHPNTADIYLEDDTQYVRIVCISIGGGLIKVKHIEIDGFSLNLEGSLPMMITLSNKDNKDYLEFELNRTFKKCNIHINNVINLEKNGKYLYQVDFGSRLSNDTKKELEKLNDIANIIII
ncbi:serine dehydratase beta chain [Clostridium luticellarii]|uniref:L-serine deaminase n=1 Tax=Clostridium luticellarii TaxID=1691940 RepID=A0A2T0BMP0_9CLOT|nr:serine dehydratase beta chain [Clostridium luticellarii]PRR85145.1 L-serine dehydratase, beta chain [Clostridium luticellarii]